MPNDKEFELDDLESFSFDDLSLDDEPPAANGETGDDPFGVWVKSAPEDVGSGPVSSEEPVEDSLPEEDFLSTEELAELDDNFDFVTVSDAPLEGEIPADEEISFLDDDISGPEADFKEKTEDEGPAFADISLDDFVSFDDVVDGSPEAASKEPLMAVPGSAEEEPSEDFLDIDIDIEDEINDEELEIIEGAQPRSTGEPEEGALGSFTAQEVDLSEFGDFEEVAPVEADAEGLESLDLPEIAPAEGSVGPDTDEGFFEEMVLEPVEADFTVPDEAILDDGLAVLDAPSAGAIDLEPDDQTDLAHLKALEEDLTSGIREPAIPAPQPAQVAKEQSSDLAALILGKIEQELSSIKQEISELKKEVTHMRTAPAAPAASAPSPVVPTGDAESAGKPRGFFEEEDDETIALTGDELDNLLSTAEISEGEDPGLALEEDLLDLDVDGNLVEPEAGHVTDEEFLAGTALDLNGPGNSAGEEIPAEALGLGIPDSIELEEGLPEGLGDDETEDLLAEPIQDFGMDPLPEGLLDAQTDTLEIPFDEDIGIELEGEISQPEPETDLETELATEELNLDSLPPLDDLGAAEDDGWSAPVLEDDKDLLEEAFPTPPSVQEESIPPVPKVGPGPIPGGSLSPTLKEELKAVLTYMDKLLASLPDDKIQEFAESEHFEVYKKLFEELGLIE